MSMFSGITLRKSVQLGLRFLFFPADLICFYLRCFSTLCLCIEIKPLWGYVANSEHVNFFVQILGGRKSDSCMGRVYLQLFLWQNLLELATLF